MITRQGWIKRVTLREFAAVRPSGLIAIRLEEGDELGWVRLTQGHEDLILVTEKGQGIRFNEQGVRAMGRAARGVHAMRLAAGDAIVSAEVVEPGGSLFVVALHGYGRRTALDEFRPQGRGGKGIRVYKVSQHTGPVVAARVVQEQDEVSLISEGGIVLRARISSIPQMKRYSRGVHLMNLKEGDRVASVARLASEEDAEEATQEE
jgi:DNA gyrase subunit A